MSRCHLQRPLQQQSGVAAERGGDMETGLLAAAPVKVGGHPVNCQCHHRVILVEHRSLLSRIKLCEFSHILLDNYWQMTCLKNDPRLP